jgi:hypothetical protein
VSSWDSLGKADIPADTDVLIIAGPRAAFLEPEATALQKHLANGGRALILLDPVLRGPGSPPPDFGFKAILDAYGVKLGEDLVVDPANALPMVGAETVLANRYGAHPIVRSLSEGLPLILPLAQSVTRPRSRRTAAEAMLVETSPEGWGGTSLSSWRRNQEGARRHAGTRLAGDRRRPGRRKESGQQDPGLVIVGSSRFAGNGSPPTAPAGSSSPTAHWLPEPRSNRHRARPSRPVRSARARSGASRSPRSWACRASRFSSASGSGSSGATSNRESPSVSVKKLLALTAVVAALFAFIVLFERKMPTTADRDRKGDLYWDIPADRVDRLPPSAATRRSSSASTRAAGMGAAEVPASVRVVARLGPRGDAASGDEVTDAKPSDYALEKPVASATFDWRIRTTRRRTSRAPWSSDPTCPAPDVVSARLAGTEIAFVPPSVLSSVRTSTVS